MTAAVLTDTAARGASVRTARYRLIRRIGIALVLAVLVVELILVFPYVQRASASLKHPDVRWLLLALVAELVSMGAFARVQRRMLRAGGARVSMRRMLALTYAANAVSVTLPGGTALSSGYAFHRLRRWGASVPLASFTLIASGALSLISFGLLGLTGGVLAGVEDTNPVTLVLAGLLLVGLVLAARTLRHRPQIAVRTAEWGLGRANRLLRRPVDAGRGRISQFVTDLGQIRPRSLDWTAGLAWAVLNWVADLACLLAACRAVGAHGTTVELAIIAYLAGMAVSSVSFLPGGIGVVDAAMVLALVHGGLSPVSATAGVLVYRLISFVLVVGVGWLTWAGTWGLDRRHRTVD